MIFRFLTIILITLHSANAQTTYGTKIEPKKPVIIAYYAGGRNMPVKDIEASKITHINYAFANIEQGKVIAGNAEIDLLKLRQLNDLREQHPHLKILISVGGWSWSDHFSDAALTEQSRHIFAQSAVEFLVRHQLDGIDLDWEYPGQPGEGNTYRAEDKKNFTLLLKAVRSKLDSLSAITSNKYLLTIATAANQNYLDHTEMHEAHKYLDYVNIMTYDFFGGWSKRTGHHTAYQTWNSNATNSTFQAVAQHIAAGIPSHKIVIGVAFYGRGWTGVQNHTPTPLYQSYEGQAFALSHDSISKLPANQYERFWDETAQAPYLWNATSQTLITYDDPQSIAVKSQLVKTKNLGGVMFWEYTQDQQGVLLETLYQKLIRP